MYKIIYTFCLLVIGIQLNAQQFSFNLYLTDSYGHSDTLIVGYDANATDSIDQQFGEVDIVNKPWDTVFESRISPLSQYTGPVKNYTPPYQSKKQILKYNPQPPYTPFSSQYSNSVFIEVYSALGRSFVLHWNPVVFADSGRMRSAFFFINGINIPRYVANSDSLIFKDWYSDSSYYLKNNDTIWLLGFSFFSYSEVGIDDNSLQQTKNISVYPNPANDQVNIRINDWTSAKTGVKIFDVRGSLIFEKQFINQNEFRIDIADLQKGVYILRIKQDDEFFKSIRLIKN